jgi:hypothetical protein
VWLNSASEAGLRTVLWQRPDLPALEVCRLRQSHEGYAFDGSVIACTQNEPLEISYAVSCSPEWQTRDALIVARRGSQLRTLELLRDDDGRWTCNDQKLEAMDGLIDVDLGFSPCTNTLAIRRCSLAIGASGELTAVWVRFPDFEILPLPQKYTRLAEQRYLYSSHGGSFTAELETDELGLVTDYGTWWHRIATHDEP